MTEEEIEDRIRDIEQTSHKWKADGITNVILVIFISVFITIMAVLAHIQ